MRTFRFRPRLVILAIRSAWRDLVRGPSVGRPRRRGYIGSVAFLVVLRWLILAATALRFFQMARQTGPQFPHPAPSTLFLAFFAAFCVVGL